MRDLSQLSFFRGLSDHQINDMRSMIEMHRFSGQHTIFHQGDPAKNLYILLEGKVAIRFKPHDGSEMTIANITPGGVFGWSAALGRQTYTSAAVCLLQTEAFSISNLNLKKICSLEDETGIIFLENLTNVIAERLNETHTQIFDLLSGATRCHGEEEENG